MTQTVGLKRRSLFEDEDEGRQHRRKFVACQRCHSHKIKCSGDLPCSKCRAVGCPDECAYASRDRQVKVSENYLDQILAENRRLKEQSVTSADAAEVNEPPHAERGPSRPADAPDSTSIQNPIIGDRAWFHRYDPSSPPIYIGEAACSAFATRFRRFLTGNNATAHITRTQWEREETIAAAANETDVQWPTLHHARLLVRIAIHQIGHLYHLMMRKSTLDRLEEIYLTGDFDCTANKCKFFALFAFGQAYSIRSESSPGLRVPGTAYFAKAMSLVQILPERTSITHLETLLTLSLFSYYLNRRHSAYVLIGNAMRMGLTIGLNHNIPESQLIDPVERQHRIEIWWTIYIFDRMWGSKMGLPMQILDEDIHVDMPSPVTPRWRHDEELSDTDYMTANIKLARIVGETISKLYSRRKYQETFLQRVQKLLKALKNWVDTLPESLRLNMEDLESSKKPVVSLHMAFNQCVILTTRPTLLHLLITLQKKKEKNTSATSADQGPTDTPNTPGNTATSNNNQLEEPTVSQPVLTLSEACIHAARHSHSMILTRWINGTMPTFGYFHAHYLFSSALILAMSSFVPIGNPNDMSCFDSALDLLRSMSENGNLAAAEFYHNLEQVKICLDTYRGIPSRPRRDGANTGSTTNFTTPGPNSAGMGPGSAPGPNVGPGANSNIGIGINNGLKQSPEFNTGTTSTPSISNQHQHPIPNLSTPFPGPNSSGVVHAMMNSHSQGLLTPHSASTAPIQPENSHLLTGHGQLQTPGPHTAEPYTFPARETISGYTTQMAFLEPTMQDFLAQSDIDLGLLHPVDTFLSEAENLYTCHEL